MHDQSVAQIIAEEILRDRRRARRGAWVKFIALLAFAAAALWVNPLKLQTKQAVTAKPYAAFVRIQGEIAPDSQSNAQDVISALRGAFDDKDAKGVVIAINSPGGTPVQSAMIYNALQRLKKEHPDKRVIVVGEDLMASGAYYVAAAGDKVIVNESTLVGSIGVVYRSFGFSDALAKLGVERRVIAAGANKNQGDPFSPMTKQERAATAQMLAEIHEQFKRDVRAGRGNRLKGNEALLFSGAVFTGARAVELGLADATGSLPWAAYDELNVQRLKEYSPRRALWSELTRHLVRAGAELVVAGDGVRLQ